MLNAQGHEQEAVRAPIKLKRVSHVGHWIVNGTLCTAPNLGEIGAIAATALRLAGVTEGWLVLSFPCLLAKMPEPLEVTMEILDWERAKERMKEHVCFFVRMDAPRFGRRLDADAL